MNCAVIDVGSNSIRLMILVDGKPIYTETQTTKLGKELFQSGKIGGEEFAHSVDVIDMFCKRARLTHAFKIYIFGTATLRNAQNSKQFAFAVYSRTGERIQVLSGEKEAEIGFIGAVGRCERVAVVIDIGGGSFEIAKGTGGQVDFSQSVDIGAVKIYSACKEDKALTEKFIEENLTKVLPFEKSFPCYAIGGTSTSIATLLSKVPKYDKEISHGYVIELDELLKLTDELFKMGSEGRAKLLSIKKERRENIASGAMLLLKIMQKLNCEAIQASEDDNLIGFYRVFVGD